jgi:two-component system sensor histidine kinase UhpB
MSSTRTDSTACAWPWNAKCAKPAIAPTIAPHWRCSTKARRASTPWPPTCRECCSTFGVTRPAEYRFLFVSEGCQKLFGFKQQHLLASAAKLFDAFDGERRKGLEAALRDSALHGTLLNWEGHTRGRTRQKWINLRSTPHRFDNGVVEWRGIVSNITQSKQAENELRESRAQLAELSSHLEAAKEEERERIARDIHDELGGTLVAIKIETSLLASKLPGDPLQLRKRVRAIEGLIDEAISTAGRVARELRPGILKDFGLAAAIECQADDFSQRVGLGCDTTGIKHDIDPDEKTSLALFRIFQEALTNVAKHAHATSVSIGMRIDGDALLLEIVDNGRGISPQDINKPKSFGLRNIRERMLGLGGSLELASRSPQGTRMILRAPYRRGTAVRAGATEE